MIFIGALRRDGCENRELSGRASRAHVLWTRETDSGKPVKRFDDTRFRGWATHCGFDWDTEEIYNIVEMRHDGAALLLETARGEKKKLDGETLSG
ncbi:MAG: hypothetical protein ACI8TL_000900 [Natronomonas sp.]|jgi:hypothetical protein